MTQPLQYGRSHGRLRGWMIRASIFTSIIAVLLISVKITYPSVAQWAADRHVYRSCANYASVDRSPIYESDFDRAESLLKRSEYVPFSFTRFLPPVAVRRGPDEWYQLRNRILQEDGRWVTGIVFLHERTAHSGLSRLVVVQVHQANRKVELEICTVSAPSLFRSPSQFGSCQFLYEDTSVRMTGKMYSGPLWRMEQNHRVVRFLNERIKTELRILPGISSAEDRSAFVIPIVSGGQEYLIDGSLLNDGTVHLALRDIAKAYKPTSTTDK